MTEDKGNDRDNREIVGLGWARKHNIITTVRFRRTFSLLVFGPSQSGKTYFLKQIITSDRILYEAKKPRRIS